MKTTKKKAEEFKRDALTQIAYFRSQASTKTNAQKAQINLFKQKCITNNPENLDDIFSFITESDIYLNGSDEIIKNLNFLMGNAGLLFKKKTLPQNVQIALEYLDAVYILMKNHGKSVDFQKMLHSLMKMHHLKKGALCPHEVLVFFGMEKCTDEDAIKTFNQLQLNYGIQDSAFLRNSLPGYECIFAGPLISQPLENTMPQTQFNFTQSFGIPPFMNFPYPQQPTQYNIPPQNISSSQILTQQANMTQNTTQAYSQNIPIIPQYPEMQPLPNCQNFPQQQPQCQNIQQQPQCPNIPQQQPQCPNIPMNPPVLTTQNTNPQIPTSTIMNSQPLNGAELIQQKLNETKSEITPLYAPPPLPETCKLPTDNNIVPTTASSQGQSNDSPYY